jgi:hypothetical protein
LDSIRLDCAFDSNEIDDCDLSNEKPDDPIISTLLGITIEQRDEPKNASGSIRVNLESDSNEIDEKPRFST